MAALDDRLRFIQSDEVSKPYHFRKTVVAMKSILNPVDAKKIIKTCGSKDSLINPNTNQLDTIKADKKTESWYQITSPNSHNSFDPCSRAHDSFMSNDSFYFRDDLMIL